MPQTGLESPAFYHRLQWKLTIRYTVVTMLVVLLLQAVVYLFVMILLLGYFRSTQFPARIAETLAEAAPQLEPYLEPTPANRQPLEILLRQFRFDAELEATRQGLQVTFHHTFASTEDARNFLDRRIRMLCVTDAAGERLVAFPAEAALPGDFAELSQAIANGERGAARLTRTTPAHDLVAAAPIVDPATGKVLGIFWVHAQLSIASDLIVGLVADFLPGLVLVPIFGSIIGLTCGYLTARPLTRRLNGIATAAGVWSRGDFSAHAPERPNDELGLLGKRLNRMARDLETRLALQQQLAAVEERNRLARELHDTIKQQLFAASMQISAAERVLERDPHAAREFLAESGALTQQMQQDLHEVIQELLPPEKQTHSLSQSLREYTAIWTRRTGIPVELRLLASLPEPMPATSRSLLRISQEALANIARHSGAQAVSVDLTRGEDDWRFSIQDDGRGFDAGQAATGLGLRNMRERAAELPAGHFELQTAPGKGTRIEIRFAMESQENGKPN